MAGLLLLLANRCWAALGAFTAPLVCQTLLAKSIPWSHFYLGSLALSTVNLTLLTTAFWPTQAEVMEDGSGRQHEVRDTTEPKHGQVVAEGRRKDMDISTIEKGPESLTSPCEDRSSQYHSAFLQ